MELELPDDFKEFLKLLTSHQVRYLLVGGFAVGYHGYPRATNDIDVWVPISQENADRLVAAFKEFGFACRKSRPICFYSQTRSSVWEFLP